MKTKLLMACLIAALPLTAIAGYRGLNVTVCPSGNEISDLREVKVWKNMAEKLGEIRSNDPVDAQLARVVSRVKKMERTIGETLEKNIVIARKMSVFTGNYSWGGPVDDTYYPVEDGCHAEPLVAILSPRLIEIREAEFKSLPLTDQAAVWLRLGMALTNPTPSEVLGTLPLRRLTSVLFSEYSDQTILRGLVLRTLLRPEERTYVPADQFSEKHANLSKFKTHLNNNSYFAVRSEVDAYIRDKKIEEVDEANNLKIKGYYLGKIQEPTALELRFRPDNASHSGHLIYSNSKINKDVWHSVDAKVIGETYWIIFQNQKDNEKIDQFLKGIF